MKSTAGKAEFAPWLEDPDPPDHWTDEDWFVMRSKMRQHAAKEPHIGDAWDESLHPRDEFGKWTFAGSGDAGAISGLPEGAKVHDRLIAQALERKAFTSTAKEVETTHYETGRRFEVVTTAKLPDHGVESFAVRPATGKVGYYNPKLADLVTTDKGVQYIERTRAQAKPGLATEITPLAGDGIMYRGMRAEEYEEFLKTGEVVSTGKYNLSTQGGLTYWADHPSTAESYANSFAPWPHKATFERPAYVVAAKIPKETRKVEGTGENEIGVARAMKRDEIIGVWRGDVYQHTPGVSEFREVAENDFAFSNGAAPSSQLVWSRIDEPAGNVVRLHSGTMKERISAAVEEAYGELHPNPLANNQVGFGNEAGTGVVMMELENYTESLYVKWLMAHPHKGGMGTQGMNYLKALATKHNVPLTLTPWKRGELGEKKLTRIFKKWGFVAGKQGLMWWKPGTKVADVATHHHLDESVLHDARPWNELLYERGNPENAGQFASKPGGSGGKSGGAPAGPKPGGAKSRAHSAKSVAGERPSAAAVLAAAKGNRPFGRFMKAAVLARAGLRKEAEEMVRPAGEAARARMEAERAAANPPAAVKVKGPAKKEDFDKAGIKIKVYGGHAGNMAQKEKEALDHWNTMVDMPPDEFKSMFMGGMDGPMTLTADPEQDKYTVVGDIKGEGEFAGVNVAHFERNIDLRKKSAYSALFEVNRDAQKAGIGKKLLAGNIETYERLGIEKVGVTAGLTVGGYAWAKYGYVPSHEDWDILRNKLKRRLGQGDDDGPTYTGGNRGSDTMEAQDWSELGEDLQDQVRTRWREDSHDEFMNSEIDNWRDSGEPLSEARRSTASEFNGGGVMDQPLWAEEAMEELHSARAEEEEPPKPFPYSDKQLYAAMELVAADDEQAELSVQWNEDKLNTYTPPGHAPGQLTLPGVEEVNPADYLTADMRAEIEEAVLKAAESKADDEAINIEPPEYLREQVLEYMTEYWDQMDESELLRVAERYDMHNVPIDEELDLDEDFAPAREAAQSSDPVMSALDDENPKAIWRVADSPRGKELLLGQGWGGTLNLKDPESYKRFKDYVGRAKKDG